MDPLSVPSNVVTPDQFEIVRYPDDEILLRNVEGSIQVVEYTSSDRGGPPAHRHPWHEVEYVIDGEAEFQIDGGPWQRVGPGGLQMLAAGSAHSVRVPEGTARLLMVTVGAPYDGFARAMASLFKRDDYAVEELLATAAKFGVTLG